MTKRKRKRRKSSSIPNRKKRQSTKKRAKHSKVQALGLAFISMLLLLLGVAALTFSFGKMEGYSMMPEVSDGDVLLLAKRAPIRFDLVYLKTPNKTKQQSVRRIIGMPGDELRYEDDQLFINGQGKSERYLNSRKGQLEEGLLTPDFTLEEITGQKVVPKGYYFVLGDNRQSATDSRDYSFVKQSEVIGVVTTRLWPFNAIKTY